MNKLDVVIAGVGGQGSLLASRILGTIAGRLGLDVKVNEVHGMSQRGGSVITYVRMAPKVYAPLIEQKGADYILAMEELEALRALPYLKPDGTMIVNTQRILPMPVIVGATDYPEGILQQLQEVADVVPMDALPLAQEAGNKRAVNTVLIGALARRLPLDKQLWLDALAANVPEHLQNVNMAAFELGFSR